MKLMICRQLVLSTRALHHDTLHRLWARRLTTAFVALNRFRKLHYPTYTVRTFSRIPTSRTRTMPNNVSRKSPPSARPSLRNEYISRDAPSLPEKDPRFDPDTLGRANMNIHEQRPRHGPKNYTIQSWENIHNSVVALGGNNNVTGQANSQTPFHPSPRMQKESSTKPVQNLGDTKEASTAPENSDESDAYVNGQDSPSTSSTPHTNTNEKADTIDRNSDSASSHDQNSGLKQPDASAEEDTKETEAESDTEATEQHTPLSYQIPANVMAAALEAPEGTKASYWSQNLYRGPNGEGIATHYCTNLQVAERVSKHFLEEKVLGFDIEWKPNPKPYLIKENASLIQIASESRIALFQIALFPGLTAKQLVPPTLKKILESPDILKVGVAVKADFTRLRKYLGIHARGVMELSRTHNLVEAADPTQATYKPVSLASQIKAHLLLPLYKGEALLDDPEPEDANDHLQWLKRRAVRTSDWTKRLDESQIHYAAADAYAGVRLYDVLEFKRKQFKPPRPLPRLCDDDAPTKAKSLTKAKKARKKEERPATNVREAPLGTSTEILEEEDSQEYETAAEELHDENDECAERNESVESDEDAESDELAESAESEESDEESDLDNTYVPRQKEAADATKGRKEGEQSPHPRTRYIGRVSLSKLRGNDLGYPELPPLASDEDCTTESAQNDLQDDVAEFNVGQLSVAGIMLEEDSRQGIVHDENSNEDVVRGVDIKDRIVYEGEADEFNDPELDEALKHLSIDDETAQIDAQAPPEDAPAKATEPKVGLQPTTSTLVNNTSSATLHPSPYNTATAWAQHHLDSTIPFASAHPQQTSRVRATISHLRAYHLWHVQQLPIDAICRILRDPPLAQSTAESYILQAVGLERLEFDKDRLREMLKGMPRGLRYGRWKALSQKVGALEEGGVSG